MKRVEFGKRGAPVAAMVVAVVIACSGPTEVCACSTPAPLLVVEGTVTDASGAAVTGAQLLFDGVPPTMSVDPPPVDGVVTVTDGEGEFIGEAHSRTGDSGELALRAAVIREGTTDTLRYRLGLATFRIGSPPDTVRVAITIP